MMVIKEAFIYSLIWHLFTFECNHEIHKGPGSIVGWHSYQQFISHSSCTGAGLLLHARGIAGMKINHDTWILETNVPYNSNWISFIHDPTWKSNTKSTRIWSKFTRMEEMERVKDTLKIGRFSYKGEWEAERKKL